MNDGELIELGDTGLFISGDQIVNKEGEVVEFDFEDEEDEEDPKPGKGRPLSD